MNDTKKKSEIVQEYLNKHKGERITVRRLQKDLGFGSPSAAHHHLRMLKIKKSDLDGAIMLREKKEVMLKKLASVSKKITDLIQEIENL